MSRIVVLPSQDGEEYALYVASPPELSDEAALEIVNREIDVVLKMDRESLVSGGDGTGAKILLDRLYKLGFEQVENIVSKNWDYA